jgi:ABC-type taurine transport system ATPase subunit
VSAALEVDAVTVRFGGLAALDDVSFTARAGEVVGVIGPNGAGKTIVDAIESGKLKGPGLVPFRYSKDSHAGFTGERLGVIKNGRLLEEGQPLVTDDGSRPIEPGSQPAEQPPANGVPQAPAA